MPAKHKFTWDEYTAVSKLDRLFGTKYRCLHCNCIIVITDEWSMRTYCSACFKELYAKRTPERER